MSDDTTAFLNADERLDVVNEKLKLIQKKNGLKFGTDAYLLAAFVKKKKRTRLVELGGGTGIVSLLCLTKGKAESATVVEIQPDYCELIERNARMNGLTGSVSVVQDDVRTYTADPFEKAPTLVISNPPYMKTESGYKSSDTGMDIARRERFGRIEDFIACASRLLQTGGIFDTVYRPERLPDLFTALRQNRLEPKRMIVVYPDPDSSPSLVLVEAQKDAAPGLAVSRPLMTYRSSDSRVYSDDIQKVYDLCSTDFLFQKRERKAGD